MVAANISQVAFALCYRRAAARGWCAAAGLGCAGFAVSTLALDHLRVPLAGAVLLLVAVLGAALWLTREAPRQPRTAATSPAGTRPGRRDRRLRWDIPLRMITATGVVLATAFFAVLVAALPLIGLPAFAAATGAAPVTQALTLLAIPSAPGSG